MKSALIICLLIIPALLSSCPGGTPTKYKQHSPIVSGNTATLPAELELVKFSLEQGNPQPVYTAFDGKYPQGWTEGLKIIDGSYLIDAGSIFDMRGPDRPTSGGIDLAARCLVRGRPQEVYATYKAMLGDLGIPFSENIVPVMDGDSGRYAAGVLQLNWPVEHPAPEHLMNLRITVNDDPGLKDWTLYTIYVDLP